jgi:hypothetical protein
MATHHYKLFLEEVYGSLQAFILWIFEALSLRLGKLISTKIF